MVHQSVFVFGGGAGKDSEAGPHTVKQVLADLGERRGERGGKKGRERKRGLDFKG